MTKKQRMNEQILQHGFKLIRIFNLPEGTLPVTLCKRIHRIEVKAHRLAEDYCNGRIESDDWQEKKENSFLKSLDKILNFKDQGIPVIINGDPRGYALKINEDYVRKHKV